MQTGAVIVDATCGYGEVYLPTAGPVQRPGDPPREVAGVLHVKLDALPALVPVTATEAYTAAIALNGVITPILLTYVPVLANRRTLLGAAANGRMFRTIVTTCVAIIAVMAAAVLAPTVAG
jgi:alanine dehydrogenase